jgi:hypothetical protein
MKGLPVRIAECDEPKFGRGIHDQILRYPTQVRHRQTRPHQELGEKVPITHTVKAILGDRVEPELLSEEFSVNNEWISCEGPRSEWEHRGANDYLSQTLEVCGKVESVG